MDFTKLAALYQETLFRTILPFWLEHSRDRVCGGFYNALTEAGAVFDTDKYVHLQAQQVWAFARLHNRVDALPAWQELARHGADFLLRHGRQPDGRWLAIVDRRGRAVAPATTVVPDCFAAMAFAELYRLSGDASHAEVARNTLQTLLHHRAQERHQQAEQLGGFRLYRHLSEPMMVLKALLEVRSLLAHEPFEEMLEAVLSEILNEFFDKRLNLLRENVLPEGAFSDSVPGRRLHPGLVFETVGYLLEAAEVTENRKLAQQALLMAFPLAEAGWDTPNGGFFQYTDLKERPAVGSEWDRKLHWVHLEALSTFTRGYVLTRQNDCLKWIRRVQEYTWRHFPDPGGQEWRGVLDRKGQPIVLYKAGPDKGCYHLIKCLQDAWQKSLEPAFQRVR